MPLTSVNRAQWTYLLSVGVALATCLHAQPVREPVRLTPADAVQRAVEFYPSVKVSQEQINAAAAGIDLARTAYPPQVDGIAQVNRATRNNLLGMVFRQSVFPNISGPPVGTNNFGTVWGSAVGVLVSWEPFDFGLRSANVAIAEASRNRSEATLRRTQFELAVATADVYLTLAAARETVTAARASVTRAETVLRGLAALVDADLTRGTGRNSRPSTKWPTRSAW